MKLQKLFDTDLETAQDLYVTAFPPEERRHWHDISSRDADPSSALSLFGIYHNDSLAGIITIWHFDAIRYIEHFAIAASMRGLGIGAQVLTMLIAFDPRPIVLEVEPESVSDIARRRIDFYRRLGFTPHPDFRYIQPPYDTNLPPVELMLMSTAPIDLDDTTRTLHRQVYGIKSL